MRGAGIFMCVATLAAGLALPTPGRAQTGDASLSLEFLEVPDRPRDPLPDPGPGAVAGLVELEGELGRFGERLRNYQESLEELLARRVRERRRALDARTLRPIDDERRLEAHARDAAIRELEAFVREHPDAPRHTPDALLRLAELKVDLAFEAFDRGDTESPALEPAIDALERVVVGFPRYRQRDRAAYLLGWALGESGRSHEGLAAWRSVVCADRFRYPEPPAAAPAIEPAPSHPALRPDPAATPPSPYEDCRSTASAALASEIWLRIGEHHFDAAELPAAIDAYAHVVASPRDRLFAFGLYKLAWSHYRAGHYVQALERFGQLVDHSDESLRRTGRAGSDLRDEAVQYVALTLAWDDWNEDGTADHAEGGPHPLERLEDGALWPQDRAWAPEVYRRVGEILFEQGHPDEAILAWQLRLTRFDAACDTPDVLLAIVRAQRQLGDDDASLATLARLAQTVGPSSQWSRRACPASADRAAQLVRRALASSARIHHRRAQELRRRAEIDGDPRARAAASESYDRAIRAYRQAIADSPDDPASYELAFDMADALYWSGRYEEAAAAYAEVRDSRLDDRFFARAARRAVEARTRAFEAEVAAGQVVERESAPDRPTPTAVPEALQRVAHEREVYARWVRPHEDEEHVRDAYAFNNALLLYRYGFWDEARARFDRLYGERCAGPTASEVGQRAWLAMEQMALARGSVDEIERLTGSLRERACSFSPAGPPVLAAACAGPGERGLACEVPELELRVVFRRLRTEAEALDHVAEAERPRRAELLAARLVAAVDRAPAHTQAPAALFLAAQLLATHARRPLAAVSTYQRIVDEVAARRSDDAAAQRELDAIVSEAHFQLGRSAAAAFDNERALASYRTLVESPRFARSDDPEMRERLRDSLVNASLCAARLGRHAEAARLWERAATRLDGEQAREARLAAAEAHLEAGEARAAAVAVDAWLSREGREDASTVRAHWVRAQSAEALGDPRHRASSLAATVSTFRASGLQANSPASELAARAALAIADTRAEALAPGRIDPGLQASMTAWVEELRRQVRAEAARVRPALDGYAAVIAFGRAHENIAALHREGELWEALVRTILETRFAVPRDIARRLRGASPAVRDDVRAQLESAVRATLDAQVRPLECEAVQRYVLAARLARRGSLSIVDSRRARERLAAYGLERVEECAASARERDPSFAPFTAGELDDVHEGRHAEVPEGSAPGALAR